MQHIWRIRYNWGDENVIPVFKKHNIAFAGKEVEENVEKVKSNDLIAVTIEQKIVAVGRILGLKDLKISILNMQKSMMMYMLLKLIPTFAVTLV